MKLILAVATIFAFAQGPAVQPNSGAWKEEREPRSDVKAARTVVKGNILSIEDHFEKGQDRGMKLKLSTESGEVHVTLGPRWVKFRDDLKFTNGEPITVVGIAIQLEKSPAPAISAEEITRNNKTLKMRDTSSFNK